MDLSTYTVDELVELIDNQPLTADELVAANDELEVALAERNAGEALDDLATFVGVFDDDNARTRVLVDSIAKLDELRLVAIRLIEAEAQQRAEEAFSSDYVMYGIDAEDALVELAGLLGQALPQPDPVEDEDEDDRDPGAEPWVIAETEYPQP